MKKQVFIIIGIVTVVLLAIIGIILYIMFLYNPALLNGVADARYTIELPPSDNLANTNNEFTLSFWYYIDGWKYKYNETKSILNWDSGKLKVDINSVDNTMVVSMKDLDDKTHECVIEDIKLQKWNFVCLTLWNRSLDIILDDKYSQSCSQDTSPDYSNSTSMILLGDNEYGGQASAGFNGSISNVYFYNYARRFEETMDLYNKGPYYKSLWSSISSALNGAINITYSVDVNLNFDQDLINTDVSDVQLATQGGIGATF